MKSCGGEEVWLHSFVIFGSSWRWMVSFTLRILYSRWKRSRASDTLWAEGWVGPTAGLHALGKEKVFYPCWDIAPRFIGRPADSPGVDTARVAQVFCKIIVFKWGTRHENSPFKASGWRTHALSPVERCCRLFLLGAAFRSFALCRSIESSVVYHRFKNVNT